MKLTRDLIIDAGAAVFAEHGYSGLSMRQVADRLGVHAGSLYYHVRNKDALLALLADRVAAQAYTAGTEALDRLPPGAGWAQRLEAQAGALRSTLRRHAGGPLLLAASPAVLSPGALSVMERMLETLDRAGVPVDDRPIAADTILSYVTGFVLQEQAESDLPEPTPDNRAELAARFPATLTAASTRTPDEMFHLGLHLLCTGVASLVPPA